MKILKKITLAVCLIFALTAVVACKESPLQSVSDGQEELSQSTSQKELGSEESETSAESSMPTQKDSQDNGTYEDSVPDDGLTSDENSEHNYTDNDGALVPDEDDIDFIN